MDETALKAALAARPADPQLLQSLAGRAVDPLHAIRLFDRAYRLHRDEPRFRSQLDPLLRPALERLVDAMPDDDVDAAARQLAWMADLAPPTGDLARILGAARLVQGRDDEARHLRALTGETIDTGFGVALDGIDALAAERDFLGTVVIPAWRAADSIGRALDSIAAAIAHYRAQTGEDAKVHIVVVDDHSPDDTIAVVTAWSARHPAQSLSLILQSINRGAGCSRNAGAAAALGRYLWFLDADDHFLERHLLVTTRLLDADPTIDFVRTGMVIDRIDAEVTPAWRTASEGSYPCNLAIRRECHFAIGGFPEEAPFRPAMGEDVGYSRSLRAALRGASTPEKTVFYTMRDGNVLDRLRGEMTGGAGPGNSDEATIEPRHRAAEILMRRRVHALRRRPATPTPDQLLLDAPAGEEPGAIELARLWIERGRMDRALPLLRGAVAGRPGDLRFPLALADALTRAGRLWEAIETLAPEQAPPNQSGLAERFFAIGVAAHAAGQRDAAVVAFGHAARLQPGLVPAQVNTGVLLIEEDGFEAAIPHLEAALAVQPDHVNALKLLAQARRRIGASGSALAPIARAAELAPDRADVHAEHAHILLAQDRPAEAVACADRAIALDATSYAAHAALGHAREALADPAAALAAWTGAITANPGFGEAFTHRALLQLRQGWPAPPDPRPAGPPDRRLLASRLGLDGRLGNQMLQYGFLRLYAERHGLTLETPRWIGRALFDLDDPPPGPPLPRRDEADIDLSGDRTGRYRNHDVSGYFCGDPGGWADDRDRFRALFRPGRHAAPITQTALERLGVGRRTIVAIHLRRGDFGWGRFWIAPEQWYLRWLERLWPTLADPLLYIATDAPKSAPAFAAYRPLTASDLPAAPAGIEFFPDFQILTNADILATSNSSFSGVAALLNTRARSIVRPDRMLQAMVPHAPWHSPILQ